MSKKQKERDPKEEKSWVPRSEINARIAAMHLEGYIAKQKGQYLRDEEGSPHVLINGYRIPLDSDPRNHALSNLMIRVCEISTVTAVAKAAIQRIQVLALEKSSSIRLRKFSALSGDRTALYVPSRGGKLLQIGAEGTCEVENGSNAHAFWVEHPEGLPFNYSAQDPSTGLARFENLIVNTQACLLPEMRWFVAMNEAFFPFIRDGFPARFLLVHIGPSQQGKTTGAQRFTLLHGLGNVKGDYSVAALSNSPDSGLLVLDNKEQANFYQDLIDFCLYLATGAERGRSSQDGRVRRSGLRPVGVITTIEGVYRAELQNRCVEVQYRLSGPELPREEIEYQIQQHRDEIISAMVCVLQRYMQIKCDRASVPNPIPGFGEHFAALCNLLRAYGQLSRRPAEWAEGLINAWGRILEKREPEEDELEHPLHRILQNTIEYFSPNEISEHRVNFQGRNGNMLVTDCGSLLSALQKLNPRDPALPRTAAALGRRLKGRKYHSLAVFDQESAPEVTVLRRKGDIRPIGIMIRNDVMTEDDTHVLAPVIPEAAEK